MFYRDYLRILVPLALAFAIYHALAVPLLEPSSVPVKAKQWDTAAIPTHENWWDGFFPADSWQRNSCRVVQSENAILLFQESTQKTSTRWLVKPLTILIPQRDSGTNKRAIFINNPEGAEIQFKTEVDWTKELPPLESGQLIGDILIYSPPDDATKNNGMRIDAHDVRINKREIWTEKAVKMQMGNSLVEGSLLVIDLDKDLLTEDQPGTKNESPFNGLNSLELFYVDRVQIGLEPGGLWPNKEIADIATRTANATLKCGGSFHFDFHQSQATMKNGVHMEHIVQGLPVDTFDCQELKLKVGWENKPAEQSQPNKPAANAGGSNWKLEQIYATGAAGRDAKDHSRWLKLNAPGMQTEAHGQYLEMNLVSGEVKLSNSLPGATARGSSPVYLRREDIQVWAPEVQYTNAQAIANANGIQGTNSADPNYKRLGAVMALGAGQAQMDNKGESWRLSWGKRLLLRPDADKDLILIEGSANISNPTHGRFIAEQLYVWLTPMTPELSANIAPNYPDGKIPLALPDRMEADGDVIVDSPQLRARVAKMQVWFTYPLNTANVVAPAVSVPSASVPTTANVSSIKRNNGSAPTTPPPPENGLALGPPTGQAAPPLTQPQQTIRNGSSLATNRQPNVPASPLNVTARLMRARVTNNGTDTRIDDLKLEGNFTLTKEQVSDNMPWPFTTTGEQLRLSQNGTDATDISIEGQPAKVAVGSGWVIAPELHLKQSENQFWIDHPGELVIPIEALQQSKLTPASPNSLVSLPNTFNPANPRATLNNARTSLPSNNINWKEPPRLQWGQRMTFDGRTARFGGGVSIDCRMETDPATLWHMNARADRMAIDMEQPIQMRSNSATKQSAVAQVAMIRLEDNVDIRAVQTDPKLVRRSIEHMKLPQLDILVPSQTWIGHGPGELWSRRYGNVNPIAPSLAGGNDAGLQCIHLTFVGRMEGAIAQRKASFYDRIQALIGPIATWDDQLNVHRVDDIRSLGRNQTFLLSDQLNIFDASTLSWNSATLNNNRPNSSGSWEIDATSRVKLDSNTDQGLLSVTAERLAYGAQNDVVKIERSQNQAATIRRTPHTSRIPDVELGVSSAAMRLKTGEIDMQISKLEGSLPANLQPPGSSAPGNPNVQALPPTTPQSGAIPSPRDSPVFPRPR